MLVITSHARPHIDGSYTGFIKIHELGKPAREVTSCVRHRDQFSAYKDAFKLKKVETQNLTKGKAPKGETLGGQNV